MEDSISETRGAETGCEPANADFSDILEGELWVKDDRIVYVGKSELAPRQDAPDRWDREIDCENNLLLPGFKNAHTHSAMTFLRSYADDLPLQKWLYQRVFPLEAKLTEEDMTELAKLGILEYLTSGITANFDMYQDNYCHASASAELGFRTVLCGSMNDYVGSVERMEEEYDRLNHMSPLVSCHMGIHAEYTTSGDKIEAMAELVKRRKAPFYLHIAETEGEVEECRRRYNMSPFAYLDSLGLFDCGGGGFHGVWMGEEDIDLCAKKQISIISNPASNLKLASGIADLCKLRRCGVNVALGTDGPASNNALDMFREMYLAAVLPKVMNRDAAAMDAVDVLRMATVGGAVAMGLPECDVLSVGKKADLIMLDMNRPNMQPENHILKNIVYSGSKDNVKLTMVDGKILYEDGSFFVGEDPEEIYARANQVIRRIS